jgi:hypothetical protein
VEKARVSAKIKQENYEIIFTVLHIFWYLKEFVMKYLSAFCLLLFFFSISINAQKSSNAETDLREAETEKYDLESKLAQLRVKYTDQAEPIREVMQQLETVKKRISELELIVREEMNIQATKRAEQAVKKAEKLLKEIFSLRLEIAKCKSCQPIKISFVRKLKEALTIPNVLDMVLAEASQSELLLIIALQNQKLLEAKR